MVEILKQEDFPQNPETIVNVNDFGDYCRKRF